MDITLNYSLALWTWKDFGIEDPNFETDQEKSRNASEQNTCFSNLEFLNLFKNQKFQNQKKN